MIRGSIRRPMSLVIVDNPSPSTSYTPTIPPLPESRNDVDNRYTVAPTTRFKYEHLCASRNRHNSNPSNLSSILTMRPQATSQTCIVADFYGKSYFDGTLLVEPSTQSLITRAYSDACASCDSLTCSKSGIDGPCKYTEKRLVYRP